MPVCCGTLRTEHNLSSPCRHLSARRVAAASLRAVEIQADVIIKGTRVDGVFNSDPEKNKKAFKFENISYLDVIKKNLRVMDLTAVSLCQENSLPILVFNMDVPGNLLRIVNGEKIGTFIHHP